MKLAPRSWFLIGALFLLVALWLYQGMQRASRGIPGVDVGATHKALDDAADTLISVDKKGDVAAAVAMLDPLTALMDKINDGAQANPTIRRCQLASAHLADGVLSVARGGTWSSKMRFENALSDCK
jgi:hypothetical protein